MTHYQTNTVSINQMETIYFGIECRTLTNELVTYNAIVVTTHHEFGDSTVSTLFTDFEINGNPVSLRELNARGITRKILQDWFEHQSCIEDEV